MTEPQPAETLRLPKFWMLISCFIWSNIAFCSYAALGGSYSSYDARSNDIPNAVLFSKGLPAISFCGRGGGRPGGSGGAGCVSGLNQLAIGLINFTSVRDARASESAFVIQGYVDTGISPNNVGSVVDNQNNAKVGEQISMIVGANGGHTWNMASDLYIFGGVPLNSLFAVNHELDTTNGGEGDPSPGNKDGGIVFNLFLGGAVGNNPVTSEIFVSSTPDANSANYGSHWGIAFVGRHSVKDVTFVDTTDSEVSLEVAGDHKTGLRTYNAAHLPYAISIGKGQRLCLNGTDSCWHSEGSYQTDYDQSGSTELRFESIADAKSFVVIRNGKDERFPSISSGGGKELYTGLSIGAHGAALVIESDLTISGSVSIAGSRGVSCHGLPTEAHTVIGGITIKC